MECWAGRPVYPPNTLIHSSSDASQSTITITDHVTGNKMVTRNFAKIRALFLADIFGQPAAGAETAARGRVHWRGHIPFQDPALAFGIRNRIGDRDCRKQRLGIRVQGVVVEIDPVSNLYDDAQVHDRHTVADVTHHG